MPILAFCLRFFRRKIVVVIIVLLSVLLLSNVLYYGTHIPGSGDQSVLHLRKLNQPFNWHSEDEESVQEGNSTDVIITTCRNSVQGKIVIADDKGYVCPRAELQGRWIDVNV